MLYDVLLGGGCTRKGPQRIKLRDDGVTQAEWEYCFNTFLDRFRQAIANDQLHLAYDILSDCAETVLRHPAASDIGKTPRCQTKAPTIVQARGHGVHGGLPTIGRRLINIRRLRVQLSRHPINTIRNKLQKRIGGLLGSCPALSLTDHLRHDLQIVDAYLEDIIDKSSACRIQKWKDKCERSVAAAT